MVISRTGSASSPPRTIRPSAPTEKSPLTMLVPEWRPLDRLHVERFGHRRHDLLGAEVAGHERQRPGADAGRRLEPAAHGGAGGAARRLAGGEHVVQERLEAAAGDELDATRRDALGVVAGGAERVRDRGVVDDGDVRRGDGLALAADEHRAALQRSPRRSSALPTQAEHRAGDQRIEHDREAARRRLARAEQPHRRARPRRGRPPRRRAPRRCGRAEKPLPVCVSAPSPAIAYARHRARSCAGSDASTPSEFATATLDRAVAVGRRLDAAHPRVGGLRGARRARARARPCRSVGTASSSSRQRSSSRRGDAGDVVGRWRGPYTRRARRTPALSRASASVSATTSASSEPAHA